MRNIAPDIYRQRLLVEGYYTIAVNADIVGRFLKELASTLNLRTYGEPIVFSPSSGMGKEENAGYDAFVPLIDSGISAYIWTKQKFFSVMLYTCKGFDEEEAVDFMRLFFKTDAEVVFQTI
jgi:hypothetical protein